MNTVIKNIVAQTYKPLLERYLSKTRTYRYESIKLEIPPGVFHPGFFFSTQFLLQYLRKLLLQNKQFLELGCGSGLISIVAAKQNAIVTATDINHLAIEFINRNARKNYVTLTSIASDLFEDIPVQLFDIIAINPPYYKKDPVTPKDHAWFCGENGEYFLRLFQGLTNYIHEKTEILMVLFDGCDLKMINDFATSNGFVLHRVASRQNLLEKNFIYKITRK